MDVKPKRKALLKPILIAAATAAIATRLGVYVWQEEHRPAILEVYVFALPSGRSIFIRTPEDKRILVDGGANSDIIRELTGILPFYTRRIDAVIATDTDGKNVTGLIDVIERYKVERVYIPGVTTESLGIASSSDQIYPTFLDTIRREKISSMEVWAGLTIPLDGKVTLRALFPVPGSNFVYSKASAPEILYTIVFGQTSITFLGNASHKVQTFLASSTDSHLNDPKLGRTDVLLITHSGLPGSMSAPLIEQLNPEYLVYSKSVQAKTAVKKGAVKKKIIDPLMSIDLAKRFNLKEKGSVKVTSDGVRVVVK